MAKKKILILLIVVMFVAVAALAVACTDERSIVSVAVTGAWKTDYAVGEAFSPCQLTVTFDNGETMIVDITPDMLSGFDTSSPGTKQVTVTYEGQSVQMTINVSSPATDGQLEIGAMPSVFYVGDELSLIGAYVIYNGTERIELTPEMISGFDTSSAGVKTLKITVNGEELSFNDINLTGAITDMSSMEKRPFTDHGVGNISLKAGVNKIRLTVNNSDKPIQTGTMTATAPMFDCIYVYSTSDLTMKEFDNI